MTEGVKEGPKEAMAAPSPSDVFLAGHDLPTRWQGREHFAILVTGFGQGEGVMAIWAAWRADPQRCDRLTVIAIDPKPQAPQPSSHAGLPWAIRSASGSAYGLASRMAALWPPMTPGWHHLWLDDAPAATREGQHLSLATGQHLHLMLGVGDPADLLPSLVASVDAFSLPACRDAPGAQAQAVRWASRLNRLAAPGATLCAQAASADVLSALASAHFTAQPPGTGTDRSASAGQGGGHSAAASTCARYAPRFVAPASPGGLWPAAAPVHRHALVIGAGLAGCSATWSLARQGWRVTLLDAAKGPAQGASGNPGGLFHSIVHGEDGIHARAHRAAALATWARVHAALARGDLPGQGQGLLRLDARMDEASAQALLARQPWLSEQARWLNQAEAQALSGLPVPSGGWHFLQAGWLQPGAYAQWLLADAQARAGAALQTQWSCQVAGIQRDEARGLWQALDAQGQVLAEAPSLVLANAWQAQALLDTLPPGQATAPLPMSAVRGQITVLPPVTDASASTRITLPRLPVAGGGYALALPDGRLLCGATTQHHDTHPGVRAADHLHNLRQAERLGAWRSEGKGKGNDGESGDSTGEGQGAPPPPIDTQPLDGRVGWRATTPDRLPLIGALPWHADRLSDARHTRREQVRMLPRERHSLDGPTQGGITQGGLTQGGLYVLSGLGSRGITWAALAGELLAHWVTGSVCPVEAELRDAMDPARFLARQHRQ